jgi:hypothetical protein
MQMTMSTGSIPATCMMLRMTSFRATVLTVS